MPRIRSLKPEFWDSPGTASASLRARLLFMAMWNWVDDWGVGDGNLTRLFAFAFPNDEIPASEVPTLAAEVSKCFDVTFYEVRGRAYFAIPSWDDHQRTEKKARRAFPGPDESDRGRPNPPETASDLRSNGSAEGSRGSSDATGGSSDVGSRSRGTGEVGTGEQGKELLLVGDAAEDDGDRPEVAELCEHLADRIEANGSKRPTVTRRWRDAARLMLDVDGRTPDQVRGAIDWCQADEFWRSNVLSMPKLREKFDQLRLAAQRAGTRAGPRPSTTDQRVTAALELARKYAEEDTA